MTTAENYKKAIISYFRTNTGLTISKAKKKIMEQMEVDRYDNDIIFGNVKLFYTDNPNYKNGEKNDGGIGWYLCSKTPRGRGEVRV